MRLSKKKCYFLAVALLWLCGMAVLIQREYFPREGEATTDYRQVLDRIETTKQSQMGIYYGVFQKERIGKTRTIIVPLIEPDQKKKFEITNLLEFSFADKDESLLQQLQALLGIQLSGSQFNASFTTTAMLNYDYEIEEIEFACKSTLVNFSYHGKVKGERLFLTYERDGQRSVGEIPLPQGTMLGSSIGTVGRLPTLEVGKRFNMRWFDPITQKYKLAKSVVLEEDEYSWSDEEPAVHAYRIETAFGDFKAAGWFTADGEMLEYQMLTFLFVKEPVSNESSRKDRVDSRKGIK